MAIEEWREISKYALARNIEISPLVQGLGHASFVLKHKKNKPLRDDPNSDWAFNPLNPKTYELQFDLYLDAIEAFPHGKYLHIGGDEVQTSGRGSGKSPLELNLIWLNKVTSFASKQNRIPIFWDDMPLKQANLMGPIYNNKMSKSEVDSIWMANEPNLNRFIEQFPKNVFTCVGIIIWLNLMEMQRQWTGSHPMDLKLWELQLDKQDGLSCHKEKVILIR